MKKFIDKNITLYNDDCLEILPSIPDKSIDCIIADLPYGTTACDWDSVIPLEPLWTHYKRIIKPKGNIVLFASGKFVFELYASQPKLYRYDLIWQKSKCGSPLTAKYMPMKMHEHILIFGESASTYNPQMVYGAKPYNKDYDHAYNRKNNHRYGIAGVHTNNNGERPPISIQYFPQKWRRQDQLHPTQKPVELMEWLIQSYSNKGDVVLDNTMGSGTTMVACVNTCRKGVGIELMKDYYDIAVKRVKDALAQPKLEL